LAMRVDAQSQNISRATPSLMNSRKCPECAAKLLYDDEILPHPTVDSGANNEVGCKCVFDNARYAPNPGWCDVECNDHIEL